MNRMNERNRRSTAANREHLHEHHRDAEAERRLDLLRAREERAHAEEEGERHVLEEDRADGEIEVVLHG
jgi:hypothetical protein